MEGRVTLGILSRALEDALELYGPDVPVFVNVDKIFERTAANAMVSDSIFAEAKSVFSDVDSEVVCLNIGTGDPTQGDVQPNYVFLNTLTFDKRN